jgi:hypothetical protein
MSDQIIDAVMAQALHADACRDHPVAGWVVMRDQPGPGTFIARLVTDAPTCRRVWRARPVSPRNRQI